MLLGTDLSVNMTKMALKKVVGGRSGNMMTDQLRLQETYHGGSS